MRLTVKEDHQMIEQRLTDFTNHLIIQILGHINIAKQGTDGPGLRGDGDPAIAVIADFRRVCGL